MSYNNYYQPNYYIEDDYLFNIPYQNYYAQPNIHDYPKNYGRKLFIRKNLQYENEPMNTSFSEGRANRKNISRIAYPSPFANVQNKQIDLSQASHHSKNTRRIPDIQSNRMFPKNKYYNSNDSSNESKSFYDIFEDSPLKKK